MRSSGPTTLGYLSTEHVVQLAKNAKCGFCTACFTGEYAVKSGRGAFHRYP